ncbi:SprT-like family-domain-containing protein [Mycena polygramma]|nr:SprT-like family-domain-containing protein [Mycena polygramma]
MAGRPGPPGLRPARREGRSMAGGWDGVEVVPDSEEERMRDESNIIEISSDEEESSKPRGRVANPVLQVPGAWPLDTNSSKIRNAPQTSGTPTASKKKPAAQTPGTPTSSRKKPVAPAPGTPTSSKKPITVTQAPGTPTSSRKTAPPRRPLIVESTSADAASDQVIVPKWPTPRSKAPVKHIGTRTPTRTPKKLAAQASIRVVEASEDSDSDIEFVSGPTPSPGPSFVKATGTPKPKGKGKQQLPFDEETTSSSSESSEDLRGTRNRYAKYWTPSAATLKLVDFVKLTPSQYPKNLSMQARIKLDEEQQHAKLVIYAEQVYSWLNRRVFKNRLPSIGKVEIVWSARFTSTAGRAQFHRTRGKEVIEIHLAKKIIDCEGRVRNTLAHEMCHLACWLIDNEINESHGDLFHGWKNRVEGTDPCIEISIEHTYEISYNFEWQCENDDCREVIGRFTNSLDPTKKKCPRCKGTFVPLFDPPTTRMSRFAAAKPTGSPRPCAGSPRPASSHRPASSPRPGFRSASPPISIDSSDEDDDEGLAVSSIHTQKEIFVVRDSDSTSDKQTISDLVDKFNGITIVHKTCLHAKRRARPTNI